MRKGSQFRQSATDMVRSLSVVLILVIAMWFFARAPGQDEQPIRVVDPSPAVRAFATAAPGAPVPGPLPPGWRSTVSSSESSLLRIGWVTPKSQYVEYAAMIGAPTDFVTDYVGDAERLDAVLVGTTPWEHYREVDGSLSLVRRAGAVTLVVGTLRASASLDELRVVAESLRPA